MDEPSQSHDVGKYYARSSLRAAVGTVYALRYGRGRPVRVPYTNGGYLKSKASAHVLQLAEQIRAHGLRDNAEFLEAITRVIIESVGVVSPDVFQELQWLQEHGDGGPEPEFMLHFKDDGPVQMQSAIQGLAEQEREDAEKIEQMCLRLRVNWPRNEHDLGACPCCGYHTLVDGPCTYSACKVCEWMDYCDLRDPWNMSKWIQPIEENELGEGEWNEEDDEGEDGLWRPASVEEARARFDAGLRYSAYSVRFTRSPIAEELPRYDWSKDTRPYHGD